MEKHCGPEQHERMKEVHALDATRSSLIDRGVNELGRWVHCTICENTMLMDAPERDEERAA